MSDKPVRTRHRAPEPAWSKLLLSDKAVAMLWSEFYQGTGDPAKMSRAYDVIMAGYEIPWSAIKAIQIAVDIHGGDMKVPGMVLRQLLEDTGAIESGYATRKQMGGGPARSFWQVEPSTARDIMTNSKRLLGRKWYSHFGKFERTRLLSVNDYQIAIDLEHHDDLAACFCAAKWIASAHTAIIQTLQQQEAARNG